jgi:hypothetical protein
MPLLNGRYRALSEIASGTFSQLIKAEDRLSLQRELVAIKVMRVDYAAIGIQARIILEPVLIIPSENLPRARFVVFLE